jgi:hypothetical protein
MQRCYTQSMIMNLESSGSAAPLDLETATAETFLPLTGARAP